MNKQVAVYDPRQQAPAPSFTMSEMERIALAIAKGRLFGSDDPNAVLTLCMVAQAEGKHPGLVMQQYHIIKGKPAKKAEAMLVDFLAAGGRVTWNKLDDECADATFSHPQGGEVTINWTMARATKAGLMNNDTWKKYPRQMLRSRVVSEGVRTVFPGATSGMYVPEEVQDFDDPAPRSDTPPTPEPKRARDLKPEKAEAKQIETKPDAKRAKAEDWLAWLKNEIEVAGGEVEAVNAVFAKAEQTLAKMKGEYPDLYDEANALRPTPSGELFDEPTAADVSLAKTIDEMKAAESAEALEAIIKGTERHSIGLTDDQLIKLDIAISQERQRFEVEGVK